MRRRTDVSEEAPRREGPSVVVPHDAANEAAVIGVATMLPVEEVRKMIRRVRPDHFVAKEHQEAWVAITELARQGLEFSVEAIEKVGGIATAAIVEGAMNAGLGASKNIGWHLDNLFWDAARATAAKGPVPAFLEALRDPKADPEKVRSLARSVAGSFDGYQDRRYLFDPERLVREQMLDVEARAEGRTCFPYGIDGLDYYDRVVDGEQRRRMLPGAAPAQITVVTGVSGSGKSTMTAHLALGLAGWDHKTQSFSRAARKVLYGAWEMQGGITLELIACISLGWSRSDLVEGRDLGHERRVKLEERMHDIAGRIRFMGNPFRRNTGEKVTNERNLDLVQGYICDSGCDVFIADLWKRCLRDTTPDAEEEALIRQQAMVEETRVHAILLQQQRLKDIEMREDKRPTREGIKGSAAWVEVADTILGAHRPALWKRMEDTRLEVCVLKQRYGKWPLAVEFDWDPDRGAIMGGRDIEYDRPGETSDLDNQVWDGMAKSSKSGPFRRRKS